MGKILVVLAALTAVIHIQATAQSVEGDRILGVYEAIGDTTGEKSHVRFYRSGDTYEAKIVWLEHAENPDGTPRTDSDNPDPELAKRPASEVVLVWGIKYDANKRMWTGGKIYNPVGGKTYDVRVEFNTPSQLKVRGYIGSPALGKNYYWNVVD